MRRRCPAVVCVRRRCWCLHDTALLLQVFLQRGGGHLAHLANSLFHTVDTSQQGALSLKVPFGRYKALRRILSFSEFPGSSHSAVLRVQSCFLPPACAAVLRPPQCAGPHLCRYTTLPTLAPAPGLSGCAGGLQRSCDMRGCGSLKP